MISISIPSPQTLLEWWRFIGRFWNSKIKPFLKNHIYFFMLCIVIISFVFGFLIKNYLSGRSNENTPAINATFYIEKIDWKKNQIYKFEVLLISNETIYTKNIVYFKPYSKYATPPIALNYTDADLVNKIGNLYKETVKGIVNTSNADEGAYNICIIVIDRYDIDNKRKIDFCHKQQISIQ